MGLEASSLGMKIKIKIKSTISISTQTWHKALARKTIAMIVRSSETISTNVSINEVQDGKSNML